jgi:capsular polysaccharide transport system permease protein
MTVVETHPQDVKLPATDAVERSKRLTQLLDRARELTREVSVRRPSRPSRVADRELALPSADYWRETARRYARNGPVLSILIGIVLPTLLTALYMFLLAADQYASEARISVRANDQQSVDVVGMLTGLTGTMSAKMPETYAVASYMNSSQIVKELDERIGIRKIYSDPERVDYLSRLKSNATLEELFEHWPWRSSVVVDQQTTILTFEARAFTPEDAHRITTEVLAASERLVNEMSARARGDAVAHAQAEVARSEERMKNARVALREFRDREGNLDPVAIATSTQAQIDALTQQRFGLEQERQSRLISVSDKNPVLQYYAARIRAIDQQIGDLKASVTKRQDARPTLSASLTNYEGLLVEQTFAEKAYTSALANLETARTDARRQQLYVVNIVTPTMPQEPTYPLRWQIVLTVFLVSLALWTIVTLVFYGVRDHAL